MYTTLHSFRTSCCNAKMLAITCLITMKKTMATRMFCLFFFHGLSLGYFESYEETLEKKKGIEKNEFE
jgi:hypothetical protein